jgi:hypothetical protein
MGDAELAEACVEVGRATAVPVDRVLEPVRVQEQRAGQVTLGVFLGHAEVHVEQKESGVVVGLRLLAVEQLAEPFRVHESAVVGEAIDRQALVGRPCGQALFVQADVRVAELFQQIAQRPSVGGAITVDDDGARCENSLRLEKLADLGLVDALEPGDRERGGAGKMAAACLAAETPAVERGDRADIDDREARLSEAGPELFSCDRRCGWSFMECGCAHRRIPSR